MKNRILALVGLALFATVSASAQNMQTNKFKVPFAFVVDKTTLPADTYSVGLDVESGMVVLRAYNGGSAIVLTRLDHYLPDQPQLDALQFQHYGNIWVLKQVRMAGSQQKVQMSKSREAELARLNDAAQPTLVASIAAAP
jgi:hypothetical protein